MIRAFAALLLGLLAPLPFAASATEAVYPVGLRQVEFADSHYGERTLTLAMFYPAKVAAGAEPVVIPFFTRLALYRDAALAPRMECHRWRPVVTGRTAL